MDDRAPGAARPSSDKGADTNHRERTLRRRRQLEVVVPTDLADPDRAYANRLARSGVGSLPPATTAMGYPILRRDSITGATKRT